MSPTASVSAVVASVLANEPPAKRVRLDTDAVNASTSTSPSSPLSYSTASAPVIVDKLPDSTSRPSRILEGLYLGADWDDADPAVLRALNIVVVVNASEEEQAPIAPNVAVENVNITDDADADLKRHFQRVFSIIGANRLSKYCVLPSTYSSLIDAHRATKRDAVLIKSPRGVSRAATLCVGYLVHQQNFTLRDAFNHVKRQRPNTRPNVGFFAQLMEFELERTGVSSMTLADYRRSSLKLWK